MNSQTEHRYAAASELTHHRKFLGSDDVTLRIAQQPNIARVALGKDKDRKTISPPPVIKLSLSSRVDPGELYMQSPYFFMTCNLLSEFDEISSLEKLSSSLVGNLVSTVHRVKVKDIQDTKEDENRNGSHDSAYFVFADVSVKVEGRYRLQFSLFELKNFEQQCTYIQSIISTPFRVHSAKSWPGLPRSSTLTQVLSNQGIKLRIARVPRTKKRGPASDDYQPRHYGRPRLSQSSNQSLEEEPESQRDVQRSPDIQHDSIDHSYSQVQDTAARGCFPGINQYNQKVQYNNYPPRKRPRLSSIHTSTDSFRQNSSVSSPHIPSPYNTIPQHSPFKYAESTNEQLQGRFYDNTGLIVSPQTMNAPQENYSIRVQVNARFPQTYDASSQPSKTNQQQPNPRFTQLQYDMPGPFANTQNLAYAPKNEHMPDNVDLYGFQPRSQSMILSSVIQPSMGRPNNGELGGYGNFAPIYSRPPYQPVLGSSQPFSVENITAAMIPSFQASTIRSTITPRAMEQSSFMRQPAIEAGMHTRYNTWGNQLGIEEGNEEE